METYDWDQDSEEVVGDAPIPAGIKAKDVAFELTPTALTLGVKGQPPLIAAEALASTVKPDDSLWEIETIPGKGRCVRVTMRKCVSRATPWEFLLKKDDVPPDLTHTDRVFFDVDAGGERLGRIVMGLYGNVAPRTCANFKHLCLGDKGTTGAGVPLHYKGSTFHRVIPNFMCQGGDFTRGDGTGGESIYGETFADETFRVKHSKVGLLSMANAGPGTNGSQFFLTTSVVPHLDGKHVVFGEVVEGYEDVVKKMEALGSAGGKTSADITIADCGAL